MTKTHWRVVGAMLALAGCDDGAKGGGATCGAGTTNADGVCLPDAADGTPDADGEPGDGAADGTSAGDGEPGTSCGAGTVEMDGECVPAPAAPLSLEGFTITQFALATKGRTLMGADNDPALSEFHPVDVTIAVRYEGDAATIPVSLGLGEEGATPEEGGSCLVGTALLQHPGTGEVVVTKRMFVPAECLMADDGSGTKVARRTMNPMLLIDAERRLGTVTPLPRGIVFSPEQQSAALTAQTAYEAAITEGESPEPLTAEQRSLASCARGTGGAAGGCAVSFEVTESEGVDFELTQVALESSVLVLNKCFEDQAALDAYAAAVQVDGTARNFPSGYVCNRSIVRGMAGDGSALPYGDSKDFTYGAADVDLDSTVTSFGIDDSPVESADELMAMGTMTDDGFVLDVKPEDLANNALSGDESYQLRYFLRPSSVEVVQAQDTSLGAAIARAGGFDALVSDKKLLPIYLHAQGEQAKADEEGSPSGQTPTTLEETVSIPLTPTEYNHGLYVENDCGRFNDPSRPEYNPDRPACNDGVNPRDEMLYGDYADETEFFVVACLVPADGATLPASDTVDNNCLERSIRLARVVPREAQWAAENSGSSEANPYAADPDDLATPGATQDQLFSVGDAADSYAANNDFNQSIGNEHIGFGFHAHSRNSLSLPNGAATDNEAKFFLRSGTLDFSLDVLRIWAQAAARTAIVGSYYDYGLEYMGYKWVGERREAEFHKEWDWNITKEYKKEKSIPIKFATIDLAFEMKGQVGFKVEFDVVSRELPGDRASCELGDDTCQCATPECSLLKVEYPNAEAIGEASITVGPYGGVTATAKAALSVHIVRAGVAGEVTIAQVGVPLKGAITWGFDGSVRNPLAGSLKLAAYANMQLQSTFMKGRIYIFADHRDIEWCDEWGIIYYPCGLTWNTFWSMNLTSWDGWTYNQLLWASPMYRATLSREGLSIPPPGIQPNLDYKIQPLHSNKCLDSWQGGGGVVQYDCSGVSNQRWRFEDMGNGQFLIRENLRRECLDVLHGGYENGYTSIMWGCHKGNNQRFQLESRGADTYLIKYVHSGKCFEIGGFSQANNAKANQWDCTGGTNQLFKITRW